MSDPVSNTQIEDVLASIRKLVSEEVRAQSRPGTIPLSAARRLADKLILSPALRVADRDVAPTHSAPEAQADETIEEAAFFDGQAAEEPIHGGAVIHAFRSFSPVEPGDGAAEALASAKAALGQEAPLDFDMEGADADGLIVSAVEEAEFVEDAPQDEWDVSQEPHLLAASHVMGGSAEAEEAPEVDEDRRAPVADSGETGPVNAFAADGLGIDPEMLRELVSDIVRQELQGALGERITRNVRKLVRSEIERALNPQDLL